MKIVSVRKGRSPGKMTLGIKYEGCCWKFWMEISSIIHGSLVLEACTLFKLCREVLGKQQRGRKKEKLKLDSRSSSIVHRHFPSIHIYNWPPAKTSISSPEQWPSQNVPDWSQQKLDLFLTKSLLAEYHQSQSHCLGNDRIVVLCCVRLQNLGSVRSAWQDFPQMMAWISRKWWREFARIVDYLTSSSTGVWKLPASRQLNTVHTKTSTNSHFLMCPYTFADRAHIYKSTHLYITHLHVIKIQLMPCVHIWQRWSIFHFWLEIYF